ncbi:hypothetical protein [Streptomyces ficellus]|uniref:Uncharacterized protein n=1 Tax=Streptomyces ficellus TaxID=1977088 RepID=A0A6I6F7R6_9ACTN|nr:hypothetical protein [Streptomyces ficellus]QGV79983.1 hypothetical protein EIZ62_18410 [Streptomyces ficellus]
MGTIDTGIAAAAALFSGVAAMAAYKTAKEANRTSASVAQIERDRWHKEMTPQVEVRFDDSRGYPELLVQFLGPAPLMRIEAALRIRDDKERSGSQIGGGPTAQQVADVIWGPYRFRPGVDGADALGRAVAPVALLHHGHTRFALEPTLAPSWYASTQTWRAEHDGKQLRLWVQCSAEGHKPWLLSADVSTATSGLTQLQRRVVAS